MTGASEAWIVQFIQAVSNRLINERQLKGPCRAALDAYWWSEKLIINSRYLNNTLLLYEL